MDDDDEFLYGSKSEEDTQPAPSGKAPQRSFSFLQVDWTWRTQSLLCFMSFLPSATQPLFYLSCFATLAMIIDYFAFHIA
ncbi:hypothetical protein CPC08DRAFT_61449 [Agrocybe pediades]|nr:hypothetical protein CPC08DRAFT_61449 [Agrocybe pediades]